jgi:hypothetical protein
MSVYDEYDPVVGDFDGNGADDILWASHPATTGETIWLWTRTDSPSRRDYESYPTSIWGDYVGVPGDYNGDDLDDIYWYGE